MSDKLATKRRLWTPEQQRFNEQNSRWGHLSIPQTYDLLDDLVAALGKIERWVGEFPPSGVMFNGYEMGYAEAFGSNGERDYMRGIARAALALAKGEKP